MLKSMKKSSFTGALAVLCGLTLVGNTTAWASQSAYTAAESVYINAYNAMNEGGDVRVAAEEMMASMADSGVSMQEVLSAAVAQGWVSTEQSDALSAVAAKVDASITERAQGGELTKKDVRLLSKALSSQVSGAEYHRHHHRPHVYIVGPAGLCLLILLILVLGSA